MRRLWGIAAAIVMLVGCEEESNDHTQTARCFSRGVSVQSYPNLPEEEWPHTITVESVDQCSGDRYGPTVESMVLPGATDEPKHQIVRRLIDVFALADHLAPCDDFLPCAVAQTEYTKIGDCLVDAELEHVHDEGMLLQGCEGSLADDASSLQCAQHVESALATALEQCY